MAEDNKIRPFVIQNPYKNTPAPGHRLVSIDELKDYIFGIVKKPVRLKTQEDDTKEWKYDDDTGTLTPPDQDASDGKKPTIDGEELKDGDRVLVTDRENPQENGVYVYDEQKGTLERAEDFDDPEDFFDGAKVWVTEGDENADTEWVLEGVEDGFELGDSEIKFKEVPKGGKGCDCEPSAPGEEVDPSETALTGLYRKIHELKDADGKKTYFEYKHGLYDSFPIVQVINKTRNAYEICDISVKSVDTIGIRFFTPPTADDHYWVIVHGQLKPETTP